MNNIYKGFKKGQGEAYRKEAAEKWGEKAVADSEKKIGKFSPKEWDELKKEGELITRDLANLTDRKPDEPEVQKCIRRWAAYLNHFYPVTEEYLRGLGKLYIEDARFTAYYEKFGKGLAEFKNKAIQVYCDNGMKVPE